jgi:hypothetical protein
VVTLSHQRGAPTAQLREPPWQQNRQIGRIRSLPVDIVRHDLIMNQQPVPDATLAEIVDKIFLPLVTG